MLNKFTAVSFGIAILFSVTGANAQQEIDLESEDNRYSYAVGNKIAEQMVAQFSSDPEIVLEALLAGLTAVLSGEQPLISESEATEIIQAKQQEKLAQAQADQEQKLARDAAFLAENEAKEGVMTTESGLQYEVLESGDASGQTPGEQDTVVVHYRGTLIDGTEFDSSYSRGEPATFSLGGIIPGWQEALQLMRPGDKWAVVLPPHLAYGERGAGGLIGPNEVLQFEIELIEVKVSAN